MSTQHLELLHQTPTPPPSSSLQLQDNGPPQSLLQLQHQIHHQPHHYDGSASFPDFSSAHPSPDLNVIGSPQLDAHSFHAPSPSPSVASLHSVHSVHSVHSIHSQQSHHSVHSNHQSPPHFGPTFSDAQIPTFHGPQRTFAGFVNSGPLTSPRATAPTAFNISPTSPFASNVPFHANHPGFGSAPPPKRLSVSSMASSNYHMHDGSVDSPVEVYGTPEAAHVIMGMAMTENIPQANMSDMHNQNQDPGKKNKREDEEWPPSWSELKTKAGKDRKRLPLACIACRRKKIRCSGQKPACKHCLRSRVPCVYKVNTRKATPRTDYMAMLDKRLKRMEERVIKLIPKDSETAAIPRAIVKPLSSSSNAKSPKRARKRAVEEAFGVEDDFDAWARPDANGENGPLRKDQPDENSLFVEGAEHLPSKELQMHLAEIYFEYVYGQSYPLLHKPTFMRNLVAGSVPPVLVLAICAISARFSHHPQLRSKPPFLRGDTWAVPAREIALKRFDTPNITILIVYLLLALHEFGTCEGGKSWMLGGMATRMALMLQLHKDRDMSQSTGPTDDGKQSAEKMSHTDREIRRRVLWSCFLMDRFISSGTDRPISIQEVCISIPLPVRESHFIMEIEAATETIDGRVLHESPNQDNSNPRLNMGTSAYMIRLVSIWGKLISYFNLGGREAENVPMWDNSSQFKELADMLKNLSLPNCLQWTSDNLATHRSAKRANQFIFLHIVYQHLRLYCYRFGLPRSGILLPRDIPQSFLTDARHTALNAANEVSILIKEALTSQVTAPFAGYAAFYASTVHVQGLFAKSPKVVERAKENLQINVRYLDQMKNWWGMFYYVLQDLKQLFRSETDANIARRNASSGRGRASEGADQDGKKGSAAIFQYGDWFDKYPNGVSNVDYEDPAKPSPEDEEKTSRGVLGANEKELLSVEDFFAKLANGELRPRKAQTSIHTHKKSRSGFDSQGSGIGTMTDNYASSLASQASLQTPTSNHISMEDTAYGTTPTYLTNTSNARPQPFALSVPAAQTHSPTNTNNMMQSPTSALSDYSAWPLDFLPATPSSRAMNNGMLGLGTSGLGAQGMHLGWYMPWNMQPPLNGLSDVSFLEGAGLNMGGNSGHASLGGGVAGATSGASMAEWDAWTHGIGGDMVTGANNDNRN